MGVKLIFLRLIEIETYRDNRFVYLKQEPDWKRQPVSTLQEQPRTLTATKLKQSTIQGIIIRNGGRNKETKLECEKQENNAAGASTYVANPEAAVRHP